MSQQFCIGDGVSEDDCDSVIRYRVNVVAVILYGVKLINAGHLSVCLRMARSCARRCPSCERSGGKVGGRPPILRTVVFLVLAYGGGVGFVRVSTFGPLPVFVEI